MNSKTLLAILAFVATFIGAAVPAAGQDGGLYVGASMGAAKARQVCAGATSCDEDETGYRFFAGYQLNKYLSAEGGYQHFSMFGRNGRGIAANALDAVVVGSYPVMDQLSVFGKAGVGFTKLQSAPAGEDTLGLTYGVGAEYAFSKEWGGRAEWQRYNNVGGGTLGMTTDIDVLSVGVVWRLR